MIRGFRYLLLRGRRVQERCPVARAVMSRNYEVWGQVDGTGFLVWGLQIEFRASMTSGEKKNILFFALTSSRNLTFPFIINSDKTPQ